MSVNPLMDTLKLQSNVRAIRLYSNTLIGTLAVDVTFGTSRRGLGPVPYSLYQM